MLKIPKRQQHYQIKLGEDLEDSDEEGRADLALSVDSNVCRDRAEAIVQGAEDRGEEIRTKAEGERGG